MRFLFCGFIYDLGYLTKAATDVEFAAKWTTKYVYDAGDFAVYSAHFHRKPGCAVTAEEVTITSRSWQRELRLHSRLTLTPYLRPRWCTYKSWNTVLSSALVWTRENNVTEEGVLIFKSFYSRTSLFVSASDITTDFAAMSQTSLQYWKKRGPLRRLK